MDQLLLLKEEDRIGLIDFQDALMGPTTYDLASFLRDSYVQLTDEQETHLLKYYERKSSTEVDRHLYGVTSLQRNLKAAGRFYYISMVKGKDTHLPYVKPSLLRAFKTLKDLKENKILSLLEAALEKEVA